MAEFHTSPLSRGLSALALGLLLSLNACMDHRTVPAPEARPDASFYALTNDNRLLTLNVRTPETPSATVSLTGLQPGERLLSMDFRPATGQLYGLGSTSRLYVINPMTGAARALGTGPFTPAISGDIVTIDFNPTVDRIRLVSNSGQNLRLNPETGAVQATDGAINGVPGAAITAVAYTNNMAGATSTTLYDIDAATNRLYKQNPPNDGGLELVGDLGLDITGAAGFDIAPDGRGLVAVTFGGRPELQAIDLNTGRLQLLGTLPATVVALAIPTNPVAYAVDAGNNLLIFNPMSPGTPVSKALTGLQPGETIQGIDFRPLNGQLYALGSTSRIYTINTASGATALVGGGPFTPALNGTSFGFDFNPVPDRIRVVSNTGQNLRLNPNDFSTNVADGALNPGTPNVSAAAYTNNFAGTTSTTLYDIDHTTDRLYRQTPPNDGTLVEVGPLGIDVTDSNGFDIGGMSNVAYAILTVGGSNRIYRINLDTGAATPVADFPVAVRAMAVGLGF